MFSGATFALVCYDVTDARLHNGRSINKKSSGSGIAENAPHLVVHFCLRPIGMLSAHSRRLHSAGRPVKPLRNPQSILTGHGAKGINLFPAQLFIRQHPLNMPHRSHWPKAGTRVLHCMYH